MLVARCSTGGTRAGARQPSRAPWAAPGPAACGRCACRPGWRRWLPGRARAAATTPPVPALSAGCTQQRQAVAPPSCAQSLIGLAPCRPSRSPQTAQGPRPRPRSACTLAAAHHTAVGTSEAGCHNSAGPDAWATVMPSFATMTDHTHGMGCAKKTSRESGLKRALYTVSECKGWHSISRMWRGAAMLSQAGDTLPCAMHDAWETSRCGDMQDACTFSGCQGWTARQCKQSNGSHLAIPEDDRL